MRVLVTGHRGFIGAHLVELLRDAGHYVVGCDLDLFGDCAFRDAAAPDETWAIDVRRLTSADLAGLDCVMHLAAISNDPMGELDPGLTEAVNLEGSVAVAEAAKGAGVGRFLFSGSCSVYGAAGDRPVTETDPVAPLTAYARSKVEAERRIAALADDRFSPVFLRNATAYGLSPMLRLDLVANDLLASALAHGEVRIKSDGAPWRPLVHCRDIARAFVAFAEAPFGTGHAEAINVGGDAENYQVRDVGAAVEARVPGARVTYTGEAGPDPRNYRVSFERLAARLPSFELAYDLGSGLDELADALRRDGFDAAAYDGQRYVRLPNLRGKLEMLAGWTD